MIAWTSGPCAALGHRFELEAPTCAREAFAPLVTPLVVPPGSARSADDAGCRYLVRDRDGRGRLTLTADGVRLAEGRTAEDLLGRFAWHVNQAAIAAATTDHVVLHAAAAVRDGVTVVLPADQEAGKTTTVAGLLRAGFDYVTDEAVAIHPTDGTVAPFPKALSLDPGSWPLFPECRPTAAGSWLRQWHVPAEHLGARAPAGPVPPPRVVVFPRYVAGATTHVRPLSSGAALRELARMTFDFPDHAARNLSVLRDLAGRASAAALRIGSLDDAVSVIASSVAGAVR